MSKKGLSFTAVGILSGSIFVENSMEMFQKRIKLPYNPAVPLHDIYSQEAKRVILKETLHTVVIHCNT